MPVAPQPGVDVLAEPRPVRAVALLLHGGRARSDDRAHRYRLAYRRMLPFARALRAAGAPHGLAVWIARYRYRGWNGADRAPVSDVRWALDQIRTRHGDVPVVLVGHSMGARAALHAAGDPAVVAVCALAPWIEPGEPHGQLAGTALLIAHGDRERTTDPRKSHAYAVRARAVTPRVARFDVHGDGHAMLRRARDWTSLVVRFALGELGMRERDPEIETAMAAPAPQGLRTPLATARRTMPRPPQEGVADAAR